MMASLPPQQIPTIETDTKLELSEDILSTSLTLLPAAQQELAGQKDSQDQDSAGHPHISVHVVPTASLFPSPVQKELTLNRVLQDVAGLKDSHDQNLTLLAGRTDSHGQALPLPAEQELGGQMDSHSTPTAAQPLFVEQENSTSHTLQPVEQALNQLKDYMDQSFTPSVDQHMSDEIKNAGFDFYWTLKGRRILRSENYIQLAREKKQHVKNWRIANLEKKKAHQELRRVQVKLRRADDIAAKSEFNVKSAIEHTCQLAKWAAADRLKQHEEKAAKLKHQHLDQVRKQVIKNLEARLTPVPAEGGAARPAKKRRTKK